MSRAPDAMNMIAIIGIATAFFAATIGLAQTDIKKVFAYSTVSQLGYMFLGVGCGAFSAGIFHLMTHAFFKALLFLGSGSVIHALSGEQDLRNMGGLRKKIPWTFATMMCAAIAISGIPPFSGFFSKDAILVAADHHAPWMYWVGVITAGMTAFYVFRAMFMAFFGEYRGHEHHPHESPPVMMIPLVILAALSVGGGFIPIPAFLEKIFPAIEIPEDFSLVVISVVFGLGGIAIAYVMYVLKPGMADSLARSLGGLYTAVYNKWYVDEIYDATVVNPLVKGSSTVLWKAADAGMIDGAVNGVGLHRPRRRRRPETDAIRQHPQLRHLDLVRRRASSRSHGDRPGRSPPMMAIVMGPWPTQSNENPPKCGPAIHPRLVLQSICLNARRGDFFVGQVGNLRPIVNRPARSNSQRSRADGSSFAPCRYAGQFGRGTLWVRPIVNRPARSTHDAPSKACNASTALRSANLARRSGFPSAGAPR